MSASVTSLHYSHATKTVFAGLQTGTISEFTVADDYNRYVALFYVYL